MIPEELVSIELNAPFDHLLSADIYVWIPPPLSNVTLQT